MESKLDLRYGGILSEKHALLFNQISLESIDKFNLLVSTLSKPLHNNLDWWFSGPASRIPSVSPLFHYFCSFNLLIKLIKENDPIDIIIVDSLQFKHLLCKYLINEKVNIHVQLKKNPIIYL